MHIVSYITLSPLPTSFISMGLHMVLLLYAIVPYLAAYTIRLPFLHPSPLLFLLLYILVATHIPFSAWRHMYTILPYTYDQSWFMYGCVHMLYCALLQCRSSYLLECHIQESSLSGLSGLSSDDSEYVVSIKNQEVGQLLSHKFRSLQL